MKRIHTPRIDLATQQQIHADLDAALNPIARKHSLSVLTLLRIARLAWRRPA